MFEEFNKFITKLGQKNTVNISGIEWVFDPVVNWTATRKINNWLLALTMQPIDQCHPPGFENSLKVVQKIILVVYKNRRPKAGYQIELFELKSRQIVDVSLYMIRRLTMVLNIKKCHRMNLDTQ